MATPDPTRDDVDARPSAELADFEATLRALPPRYEPNAILRWLYRRFFDSIPIDPTWAQTVRDAARTGTVVYALRNLSLLDFLALDHLTKRHGLPQVRFANDLGLWILEPFGKGFAKALKPRTRDDDLEDLRAAVARGESAALFLKRPPGFLAPSATGRGLLEGDDFVRELLDLQRGRWSNGDRRPIIVVPQLFLWTKRPDTRGNSLWNAILGTREWPGAVRTVGQFLSSYREVAVRAGEPLDLSDFLRSEESHASLPPPRPTGPASFGAGDSRNDVLVRRVIYLLLKRLERERRVIVGPVVKASDRLVEEIVRMPRVRKVIEELAGEGAREKFIVEARARAMLREMAAAMEPDVIKLFGTFMEGVFHRIYEGLEIDKAGIERIREAARHGTVILLPSHKSHVDYLFVSYVLWRNDITPPLIAAGDNLAFFPMGSLFRRAGAFFIRRKIANDRLYGAILDAYVHKIVKEGYSIEFFLEGGRSRTGKLLPPKLGLLSMVVDAAYEVTGKPVVFVPISIGYERVVESKSYVKELSGGEKEGESVTAVIRAARVLVERYGRLNLQVGELLTIDRIRKDVEASQASAKFVPKRAIVARLAHQIIYEINRATAVTGGSLVAMALLVQPGRGVTRSKLLATCDALMRKLRDSGARLQPSLRGDSADRVAERAVDDAIGLFASAGWIEVHDEDADVEGDRELVYVVPEDKRLSIDISKNVIVHFFVPHGLIATAMGALRADDSPIAVSRLRDRVQQLSRLFKFEFMFRADATFETNFDETLGHLVTEGSVRLLNSGKNEPFVSVAPGDDPRRRIELYAATIASFLEGYRVAARSLASLTRSKTGVAQKDLVKRALSTGRRMNLAGEVVRREGVCRPVIENALSAFLDQGYLARSEGKLVLSESFATLAAVSAIERRIAAFLPGALPSEIEA